MQCAQRLGADVKIPRGGNKEEANKDNEIDG
jgi:hypothetical protein